MPDLSDAPRKSLTVNGVVLTSAMPYSEGHTLTANEAATLCQTWQENLRNNFHAKVGKLLKEGGAVDGNGEPDSSKASPELISSIQKAFDEYQDGYEFGVRGGREADPVRAQAKEMARAKVREALKADGYKLSEVGTDKINELAEQAIEKNPNFLKRAQEIVDARKQADDELSIQL